MQMHLAESTVQRRRLHPSEIAWVRGCNEFYAVIEWRPRIQVFDAKVVPIQYAMVRGAAGRIEMDKRTYRLRTPNLVEAAAFVLGICSHRRPNLKPGARYYGAYAYV